MAVLEGITLKDRYFLRRHAGSGGFSDVYQAWDALRATKMAVKVMRPELVNTPKFFKQFSQEAEVLRKLEHPNIVRLYEFDRDEDIVFIVMDWIEGDDGRQLILKRRKPLALDEVSVILSSVSTALNYAHGNKIFHCDIKPANILLQVDQHVFLSDFGVARLAAEKIGGGTPSYMAPELFNDVPVGIHSDIYSLGITLYEMLSGGYVPFRGETPGSLGSTSRERIAWEHLYAPLPSLRQYNPSIPGSVEEVIGTALSKEPENRFESVLKFREAFEQARIHSDLPGKEPRTQRQPVQPEPQPNREPDSPKRPAPPLPPPPVQRIPDHPERVKGPYLIGQFGEWAGRIIGLPAGNLTMGRNQQNQVIFSEPGVSRSHATLIQGRKGVYIRDENSTLGTYVNGVRIAGSTLLKSGDKIQIGREQVFEFRA